MATNLESVSLAALRQGDEKAFDQIYNIYHLKIYIYSYNLVKSKEDAQDITAETFMEFLQKKEIFNDKNYINNFLYVVARNKCFNFLKACKAEGKRILPAQQQWLEENIQDKGSLNFQNIVTAETSNELWMKQVRREIDQLSPQRKEVFILFALEHWTVNQIADHLHKSPKTVYKQIEDAKKILKRQVRKKGYELILYALWLLTLFFKK